MTDQTNRLGQKGEQLAAAHLVRNGYEIVELNWRCREGEVDIIAKDGPTLVFIEVKSGRNTSFGSPEQRVNPRKQAQLTRAAISYLQASGLHDMPCRFDVVAVSPRKKGAEAVSGTQGIINEPGGVAVGVSGDNLVIRVLKDAFEMAGGF